MAIIISLLAMQLMHVHTVKSIQAIIIRMLVHMPTSRVLVIYYTHIYIADMC